MRAVRQLGFTLLEVVVAMAILSMSLMAIFNMNAGAIRMHTYTKKLTVATLLARSKMTDIEQHLYDKGFNVDDEEDGGDFSDDMPLIGSAFKWRVKILAPKTDGVTPEQVIGAVFGIPLGGLGDKGGGDSMGALSALLGGSALGGAPGSGSAPGGLDPSALLGGLGGLLGGGGTPSPGGGPTSGGGGLLGMLGPLASTQFQQMVDQISKSVREIHLTVSWKDGKTVESIDLVTDIVAPGPGSDRNGAIVAGQSMASTQAAASASPTGAWVDSVTNQPAQCVQNPNGGGGMVNPVTGNQCVPAPQGAGLNPMLGGPQVPPPAQGGLPNMNFGNQFGRLPHPGGL